MDNVAGRQETARPLRIERWVNPLLLGWFVLIDVVAMRGWLSVDGLAGNVQSYTQGAVLMASGGDPWATTFVTTFGDQRLIAPPPALLPFLLTAWLPMGIASWLWVAASVVSAVWIIRRLRLPWLFLAFPPLVAGAFWGSSMIPLALALVGPVRWLGAVLYPTWGIALLAERRWRQIIIAAVVTLASFVVLPWGLFLSHLSEYGSVASMQAQGGLSAFSVPLLAVAVAGALVVLGWRRGLSLAVPGLAPATQLGYACIALPVLAEMPLVAAAVAIPVPLVGPVAILVTAAWLSSPRQRSRTRLGWYRFVRLPSQS